MNKTFEILSIVGLLMIAAFLDIVYQGAKQFDPTSLQPNNSSLFGLRIFSTIFITIVLLSISWYLLCRSSHDSVVTAVCIILGVITLLLATVPGTRFVAQINLSRSVLGVGLSDIVSSNLSLTSHSAAFVLCIGIIRLFPDKYLKKL